MANNIKLNTDLVKELAECIRIENQNLQQTFDNVNKQVLKLNEHWRSKAGSNTVDKFNKYRNTEKQRLQIMNNLCSFLREDVATGGEVMEEKNTTLADKFK